MLLKILSVLTISTYITVYCSSCDAFIILMNSNGNIQHYVLVINGGHILSDWIGYSYSLSVLSCHLN